jgi:DNA polymerase III epsilon subunit-like protein
METSDLDRWKRHDRGIVIVIDTETTGLLDRPWAVPVEVGAVALDVGRGVVIGQFGTLIRPASWRNEPPGYGFDVSGLDVLSRIAKIDPGALENAPTAVQAIEALFSWASGASTWTAYNVPFDRGMLERIDARARVAPWGPCLMGAARDLLQPGDKWLSLARAASLLGIAWPEAALHRAVTDATLAALVGLALRGQAYASTGAP